MTLTHLLILILGTSPIPRADTLVIQFVGNAAFALSDGITTLATDFPYQSGAFGYMTYDPAELSLPGGVVSVITHRHADHFDANLFNDRDWEIVGPREVTRSLARERVVSAGEPTTVGAFVVTPHRTSHSDTEHYSYVIEWNGLRLFFTGDTEDPAQLLSSGDLDIAFVTPWLLCEVAKRHRTIPAQQVVLHHQFPDGRSRVCGSPRILRQGERMWVPAQHR